MTTPLKLTNFKKIHFIGIGGIGISAIARMLMLRGARVSGSDQSEGEVVTALRELGADITLGHSKENIPQDVDLVVYTIAIPDTSPELVEARSRDIPVVSYPETLSALSGEYFTIAISGTHGKTTTTGMIAHVLLQLGKDPTVIIGSLIKNSDGSKTNFISGKSRLLVVEACEYRRSFLNITPDIAVITNIEEDHLDYYADIVDIKKAFKEFVGLIKPNGTLVLDLSQSGMKELVEEFEKERSDIKIVDYGEYYQKHSLRLKVPGIHNQHNAGASLATCAEVGLDENNIKRALETFVGTWRRFEYRGETKRGVIVYDDYAHHPREIQATLEGARSIYPDKRLVVVFQPHLFSRTKQLFDDFSRAFDRADKLILVPIYPAREKPDPSIDHYKLAEAVKKESPKLEVEAVDSLEKAVDATASETKGAVLIVMGAGDVYEVSDLLLEQTI